MAGSEASVESRMGPAAAAEGATNRRGRVRGQPRDRRRVLAAFASQQTLGGTACTSTTTRLACVRCSCTLVLNAMTTHTSTESAPSLDQDLASEIRRQAERWLALLRLVFRQRDSTALSWIGAETERLLIAFAQICSGKSTGGRDLTTQKGRADRMARSLVESAERSDIRSAVCAIRQQLRHVHVDSGPNRHPGEVLALLMDTVTAIPIQWSFEMGTPPAASLETFNRALAHEIRNPLGAAAGASHALQDDRLSADPEQRRLFVSIVQRSIERAGELVDDLSIVLSTYGSEPTEPRRRPLCAVIDDVRFEVAPAAHNAGIALDTADSAADVLVDASRVSLVLANLLWNAVKYADPTKPERWVRVDVQPADDRLWHCSVADNGLGIPIADQPRIFERFHRAHADTAPGSGLGLAICREAVRQKWVAASGSRACRGREAGSRSHSPRCRRPYRAAGHRRLFLLAPVKPERVMAPPVGPRVEIDSGREDTTQPSEMTASDPHH